MHTDNEQIDSIAIVGGGDSGLMTALALQKGLENTEIVVIDNFEASVPEVGKSTLHYIVQFLHDHLDIPESRLVSEVNLAWKTTVYLKDWCGVEPFHSPLGQQIPVVHRYSADTDSGGPGELRYKPPGDRGLHPDGQAEFQELYYRYRQDEFSTLYGAIAERQGKTPFVYDEQQSRTTSERLPAVAYHFDSRSLNDFLRTLCRERGVELVDDRITGVTTADDRIERIGSDTAHYTADLYVDASGFSRILMGELDNTLVEFDLPVDSALVTTTDIPLSEIVSATVVTTGDAGWFWQIDTPGLRDLGYVYSSSHISDEAATHEFIETREETIDEDEIRQYRFTSGVLERPWVTNCVASGNALGFVEPLQSTALSTTAGLVTRLTRLLSNHGRVNHPGVRQLYNQSTRATWEEVYTFISIYYKYSAGTTPFWKDARAITTGSIPQYEDYQDSGFSAPEDHHRLTRPDTAVNGQLLYYLILHHLGVESAFYEDLDVEVDQWVVDQVESYTASLQEQIDDFLSYEEFFEMTGLR